MHCFRFTMIVNTLARSAYTSIKKLHEKQKRLTRKLYKRIEKTTLPVFLPFSYVGARVCYSETHPLLLFEEEKFKNHEKFREFLLRLKKAGHYSVFAHTPVFVNTSGFSPEEKFEIASTFFKVFWNESSDLALFNLRHFAETLDDDSFLSLIEPEPDLNKIEIIFARNYQVLYQGSLSEFDRNLLNEKRENRDFFVQPEVVVLKTGETRNYPFNWIGVIAHNFSRIFSHQFVRHTWLNFNQRSHRYTKVDSFVIPESFSEEDIVIYEDIIRKTTKFYELLYSEKRIKKEDARFMLPQGTATTVFATAPDFVWEDFISKRAIPQAQGEIRKFASFLKNKLLSQG